MRIPRAWYSAAIASIASDHILLATSRNPSQRAYFYGIIGDE